MKKEVEFINYYNLNNEVIVYKNGEMKSYIKNKNGEILYDISTQIIIKNKDGK